MVLPAAFPQPAGQRRLAASRSAWPPPSRRTTPCELIDACLLLLQRPEATTADLLERVPGPDFPTGGVIVESKRALLETYETGRGGVRVRARWHEEDAGTGAYRIVVTEMPYQVPKSRLVEALAALIELKKAPLLGDVRDESAEDIRLVIEPKTRAIEPDQLMESLFRLCDLEVRFPVNMNVLDETGTPRVMGLKPALQAFLDHRREVDGRRARFRLGKIDARLHILDGLLIVYLDLDEVIRIVRFEDEPKARPDRPLRAVRHPGRGHPEHPPALAGPPGGDGAPARARGPDQGARRTGRPAGFGQEAVDQGRQGPPPRPRHPGQGALRPPPLHLRHAPAEADLPPPDAYIVREPITVILSERGWIRAAKGAVADPSELKFKEGDRLAFLVPAETTDRLLILATDGRFFTLACDKLPSARGQGEPLRLMLDVDDRVKITAVFPHKPGRKRVLASNLGYGFLLDEADALANRRAGKAVLNVGEDGGEARLCLGVEGDHLAVIGDNGKLLVFPLSELPEMPRGKGVKLQAYREGGLRDAMTFDAAAGLSWIDSAGRKREWKEWRDWLARRASAGKLAPRGFPSNKRFRPG